MAEAGNAERDERDDLVARRYREARDYGFSREEARAFSRSNIDVWELRRLRKKQCPAPLAARILL